MNRARKQGLFALGVIAAWTALALLFAVTSSWTYMSTGRPPRWGLTIKMALADWWIWAALTFPVLWLTRRLPLERATLLRNVPPHLLAAVAISIAKVAADRGIRRWVFGFPVSYFLISSLAPQFVIYWAIVASAHGLTYYRRSRERELEASQLEARLADMRLQLLQMQLQPHFLFNTLHAISELVHENPETADRMIGGLSDLLREALDASGVREVPLERELQLLNRYVEIQTARFGDRLTVVMDVDERALGARLPSLILQPLVENAIRHGLASRRASGRIDVRATMSDDRLIIEVADDGGSLQPAPGVGPRHIEQSEGGALRPVKEGVGLGNTRARLQELYGSHYTLDMRSRPAGGVSVIMTIPLRVAERS